MRRILIIGAVAAIVMALGVPPTPAKPFRTDARAQLVAIAAGVMITPLLTAGDVVGNFQFTGVPDGIGVYENADGRLVAFVNHEIAHEWGDVSDARVSSIVLSAGAKVVGGSYMLDGSEGYQYFCSGTMSAIGSTPWYFAGEEWIGSPKGGIAVAINAASGRVVELPQFGSLSHENVVPMDGMSQSVVFLSEDSFRNRSQAYAYFADSLRGAIQGKGKLAAFVPNDPGDGDPSANDLPLGSSMKGRFVTIPQADRYSGLELNAVTEQLTPFNFIRVEDAAPDPSAPGVLYFSDTGSYRSTSDSQHGRIYRMTFNPSNPRRATLEVVQDGDNGSKILNPDNLGISGSTLMIQEDHNRTRSRYNRVWAYDLVSETLTAIARTDPTVGAITRGGGKGVWESSGIVDASAFFGPGAWLLNVQAHDTKVLQQGPSLAIDSASGEGGQMVLLQVPVT
jgi:hypothetical protein